MSPPGLATKERRREMVPVRQGMPGCCRLVIDNADEETAMQDRLDPLTLAAASFVLAALAGVAALLRSSQELTVRTVLAVVLNSGLLGLAAALLLFSFFKDNAYFLVGLCILAGLGGLTVVGFVLQVIRQGGIDINITTTKPEEDGDVNDQA